MKRKLIMFTIISSMLFVNSATFAQNEKINTDLYLNSVNLEVNGVTVQADNILYEDSTYVPLRKTAEMLGKVIDWNDATKTANIKDNNSIDLASKYPIDFVESSERYKIDFMNSVPQSISQQYNYNKQSDHFIVHYNTSGSGATNEEYVNNILKEFEKAYDVYFNKMDIWMPLVGKIYITVDELGSNTGMANGQYTPHGTFAQRIAIDNNVKEDLFAANIYHELFHIIQAYYFYLNDSFFLIESVPSAAAYAVGSTDGSARLSVSSYFSNPDYFISGERNSTVMFMIYLYKEYNLSFKKLLEAEALGYKDIDAIRAVLAEDNVTFEEAYSNFTWYVFVNNLLDYSDFITMREKSVIAEASWNGSNLIINKNTNSLFWDKMKKVKGEALEIKNKYGSTYVRIIPNGNNTMNISVDNSKIHYSVVGIKSDGSYKRLSNTVTDPSDYKEIIIAATKIDIGNGKFVINIQYKFPKYIRLPLVS